MCESEFNSESIRDPKKIVDEFAKSKKKDEFNLPSLWSLFKLLGFDFFVGKIYFKTPSKLYIFFYIHCMYLE